MSFGSYEKLVKVGDWFYFDSLGQELQKEELQNLVPRSEFEKDGFLHSGKCLNYFKEEAWYLQDLESGIEKTFY